MNNKNEAALSIQNVSFSFGKTSAVKDFSLNVSHGSFTTLLGPSGCGKTTLLRLISGFLMPESGSVFINGKNQKGIAPNVRQVGMVFQDYALFPHMTVEQNLLYGIKLSKKIEKNAQIAQIHQTARILGIAGLLERFPHELSGGQQQRVALGRALVLKPEILLMDEPLSSLDAKLRIQVREELKEIQKSLGITTIYVTHDQEEALSLSDTIAVMNHGKLLQSGTPKEIYFSPKDTFTADFVGRANFIEQDKKTFMFRPEWIELEKINSTQQKENTASKSNSLQFFGKIISSSFLGNSIRYRIELAQENPEKPKIFFTADVFSGKEEFFAGEEVLLNVTKTHIIGNL